jgi:hypothetical protein
MFAGTRPFTYIIAWLRNTCCAPINYSTDAALLIGRALDLNFSRLHSCPKRCH